MKSVKNGKGWIIGFLKESDQKTEAFSSKGVYLGAFHKKKNQTIDRKGMVYSQTDSTNSLIHSASP